MPLSMHMHMHEHMHKHMHMHMHMHTHTRTYSTHCTYVDTTIVCSLVYCSRRELKLTNYPLTTNG